MLFVKYTRFVDALARSSVQALRCFVECPGTRARARARAAAGELCNNNNNNNNLY